MRSFERCISSNNTHHASDVVSCEQTPAVATLLSTLEVTSHVDDYNGSFRDTVWLTSFPLNAQTVLHYFALSPFYDRTCNNERLKMQRLALDQLKNMRGVEYELMPNVAKQLPQQLFLIRKQRRSGRTQVKPLAMYYVLDGTIYQAPNIHAMLTSRLVKPINMLCVTLCCLEVLMLGVFNWWL